VAELIWDDAASEHRLEETPTWHRRRPRRRWRAGWPSGSRELAALSVPGNHLEDGRLDREMVGTDSAASW